MILLVLCLVAEIVLLYGMIVIRSRWFRRPAILVFMFMALFVLMEAATRIHNGLTTSYWRNRESAFVLSLFRGHAPRPDYHYYDDRVVHNRQGFRARRDIDKDKRDQIRIFLCGGSAAYGIGSTYAWFQPEFIVIRNEDCIDAYLEQFLSKRLDRPVEVINASSPEYRIHHHLTLLFESLIEHSPDLIIFFDGHNDYNVTEHAERYRISSSQDVYALVNYPSFMNALRYGALILKSQSMLFRKSGEYLQLYMVGRQIEARLADPLPIESLDSITRSRRLRAPENFMEYVRLIVLTARTHDIVPFFALQPDLIFDTTKPLTPFEKTFQRFEQSIGQDVEFNRSIQQAFVDELGAYCRAEQVGFLDLTQPFAGVAEQTYIDYCHLSPAGNRIIAEKLGESVLPVLEARLSAKSQTR